MTPSIYTVGHSNRSLEEFLATIATFGVTAIADVRSSPYSRLHPQFNRESLSSALRKRQVAYAFLGRELGARPPQNEVYVQGVVSFAKLASSPLFQGGLQRVLNGSRKFRIALLCAERDPAGCHRAILVGRHLASRGATLSHIVDRHALESNEGLESRLLALCHLPDRDMFRSRSDLLDEAYRLQESRIAYRTTDPNSLTDEDRETP